MGLWLMHRGEEGVGYAYLDGGTPVIGEPPDDASAAIVHTRYSTVGPYSTQLQPVLARYRDITVAVAFNGTVVNYKELASRISTHADNDSVAVASFLAWSIWEYGLIEGLRELLRSVIGAISMVALIGDQMVAVRDPRGIRPLSFSGSRIASESSVLGPDADDVPPGHAVVFPGNRVIELLNLGSSICALEFVYFARPESVIGGRLVYDIRYRLGEALAEEEFASIDAVTYIPETARIAALGYSNRLGRPIIDAIQKNRYIGRVFIKPPDARRSIDAFHIVPIVKGLRIAVIDDSLIRGTNIRRIVSALKAAGAREVHVRIASPPIKWPCFMGIPLGGGVVSASTGSDVSASNAVVPIRLVIFIFFSVFIACGAGMPLKPVNRIRTMGFTYAARHGERSEGG